jgi:ribosomal-protein-alanine N-acetyltransferase
MCGGRMRKYSGRGVEVTGAKESSAGERWEVRGCEAGDVAAVLAILREAREAASWSETSLREALKEEGNHFLVARKGEDVLGFIVGRRVASEGEILNLAVRREWRRRGIGEALVEEMLASFQREKVATVFLEVRESNAAAVEFYGRLGFSKVGRRVGYYREPEEAALVLRRDTKSGGLGIVS